MSAARMSKRISMSFSEAEVRYLAVLVRQSNPTGVRRDLSGLLRKLDRMVQRFEAAPVQPVDWLEGDDAESEE
jgi:hypothetical protein